MKQTLNNAERYKGHVTAVMHTTFNNEWQHTIKCANGLEVRIFAPTKLYSEGDLIGFYMPYVILHSNAND
jgi:hypothetical protein